MGLDRHSINYLIGESRRGIELQRLLTLGHQSVYMSAREYAGILESLGQFMPKNGYSDEFFRGLGTTDLQFMDASGYEGATIIHDLNDPIPKNLIESFDCVIDGGTLEHVFNFPTAIRSCMQMVAKDGTLILITPWHNYSGHGFFQFSPELFYSLLSESNGFEVERMLIVEKERWYSVASPAEIRGRVEIETTDPILLYITARRKNISPILETWPQQSDYMTAWTHKQNDSRQSRASNLIKKWLIENSSFIRDLRVRHQKQSRRRMLSPSHNKSFTPVSSLNGIPVE